MSEQHRELTKGWRILPFSGVIACHVNFAAMTSKSYRARVKSWNPGFARTGVLAGAPWAHKPRASRGGRLARETVMQQALGRAEASRPPGAGSGWGRLSPRTQALEESPVLWTPLLLSWTGLVPLTPQRGRRRRPLCFSRREGPWSEHRPGSNAGIRNVIVTCASCGTPGPVSCCRRLSPPAAGFLLREVTDCVTVTPQVLCRDPRSL